MLKRKITIIIQARTASQRLSRKVLRKILGRPMIWYILRRIKESENVAQVVLATTKNKEDDILADIAKKNKILVFRGDDLDVLNRYYECAKKYKADPIIRITADCPLIDSFLVDEMIDFYLKNNYDYVSNTIIPTYPDGLDVEIFSFKTLEFAVNNARKKSEREHVTVYIKNNPQKFKLFNYKNENDLSNYRWTVDEEEDLLFVRKIYSKMKPDVVFKYQKILELLSSFPDLLKINQGFKRNEGYKKSLENDDVL